MRQADFSVGELIMIGARNELPFTSAPRGAYGVVIHVTRANFKHYYSQQDKECVIVLLSDESGTYDNVTHVDNLIKTGFNVYDYIFVFGQIFKREYAQILAEEICHTI